MDASGMSGDANGNGSQTSLPSSGPAYLNNLGQRLLYACRNGDVGQVQRLLHFGAPYVEDWLGNSALHFAAMNGHVETCQYLIDTGVKRDVRTKVERTPLHLAAQEGHHDVVELLLKSGADRDAVDGLRMTALHWASEHCHVPVIQMLINYGASLQIRDKFERTPLIICANKDHLESCQTICRAMYGDSGPEVVLSHSGETEAINLMPNRAVSTTDCKLDTNQGPIFVPDNSQLGLGTQTGSEVTLPNPAASPLLAQPGADHAAAADEEEEDMGSWPVCMEDESEVRRAARNVLEQLDRLHAEREESEVKVDGLPTDGGVSWLLNFLELEGLTTQWVNQDEGVLHGSFLSRQRQIHCKIKITDHHLIFKVALTKPEPFEEDLLSLFSSPSRDPSNAFFNSTKT